MAYEWDSHKNIIMKGPMSYLLQLLHTLQIKIVATLALGSRPRQGLAKLRAKRKPRSHAASSRECKRV